jgi:hypothetical protein
MPTATKEKPSTELATIDTTKYLALQEGGAIQEAIAANLGEGATFRESDLTRVPIPTGGSTTWLVPSVDGDRAVKAIEGILVYQTVRGVLWASEEPEEGSLPVLVSTDLKTARLVAPENVDAKMLDRIKPALREDGTYDWTKLPQNEWGSGKGGVGKAAKEQRVLYILTRDEPLPLVVIVQPGSLKGWREFMLAITKAGIPYYRAVVSLTLEKDTAVGGAPYAKVKPELAGRLTLEQGQMIQQKFAAMRDVAASAFSG